MKVELAQIAIAAAGDSDGVYEHIVALDKQGRPWRFINDQWKRMKQPQEETDSKVQSPPKS